MTTNALIGITSQGEKKVIVKSSEHLRWTTTVNIDVNSMLETPDSLTKLESSQHLALDGYCKHSRTFQNLGQSRALTFENLGQSKFDLSRLHVSSSSYDMHVPSFSYDMYACPPSHTTVQL